MEFPAPFTRLLSAVLDHHPRALMLVDASRRVLYDNEAARLLLQRRTGVHIAEGRLCVANPASRVAFDQLLMMLSHGRTARTPDSTASRGLRVVSGDQSCLLVMHRIAEVADTGTERAVLIELTAGRQEPERSAPLLADLFGATRREVSVAAALIRGDSVERAATSLGITVETIRSHAKSLFRKCEVHSRAELIALISSLSQFAGLEGDVQELPSQRSVAPAPPQAAMSTATRAGRPLPISSVASLLIPSTR